MSTFFQDFRLGLRRLRRAPAFALVAVVTLALGIGANTAIFSLVNTVVLHALPYPDADRLVRVDCPDGSELTFADAGEIREQSHSLQSIGVYTPIPVPMTLTGGAIAARLRKEAVSPEVFPVLGVTPLLGRAFLRQETRLGEGQVAILSYAAWEKYLGADRGVIGRTVALDRQPYIIVGVMPPGFAFPSQLVDVWTPLSPASAAKEEATMANMAVGRLKPGVKPREAEAELNVIADRLKGRSRTGEKLQLRVTSLQEQTVGPVKKALFILLGAVGLVLLLACSNVANLLVARNAGRRREIATCAAMGATRPRLVRQLLTESVLLAMAGGFLGLVLAFWGLHLVKLLAPPNLPRLDSVGVNGWVLAFTFAVSVLAGLVFGILPAFVASKPDLIDSLKEGSGPSDVGYGPSNLLKAQGALTACQAALATVLLIGAGLIVQSLTGLMRVHLGFDPHRVLVVEMDEMDLVSLGTEAKMLFYQRVLDEVHALPGVESAALSSSSPLGGGGVTITVYREGESLPSSRQEGLKAFMRESQLWKSGDSHTHFVPLQKISAGYFRTMRIAIREGRAFSAEDRFGSPFVAVVNEALAHRLWPNGDAVGKKICFGSDHIWFEVVGVADNARDESLEKEPGPKVYLPYLQLRDAGGRLVVRTAVPPQRLSDAIVNRMWSANANEGIVSVQTMDEVISKSLIGARFHAALFSLFAFLALVMASVGVYGVVSYSVSQRTREIGIRMALGARPADVLVLVIGQKIIVTAIGIAAGLAVALALTRTIASLLFGVAPNDLGTFVEAPVLFGLSALVASYIPTRRALRVDPAQSIRWE
jgi:putative ABC transport system permease protein